MSKPMPLPQKSLTNRIVFALLMAFTTTSIVVLVTVLSQVGLSEHLFNLWLRTFAVDYLIVVATIVFFAPRLQSRLFRFSPGETVPTHASRIKFALVMAMLTVSSACFFGLLVTRGFNTEVMERFVLVFPFAYVTAVPFILLIAPRLQRRIDWLMADPTVR